jgi:hypothetical protein
LSAASSWRRYHVPWDELPEIVREDIVTGFVVFFIVGVIVGAVAVLLVEWLR